MVSRKTLVCLCEDITLDDVTTALHEGYEHFEDLKRYLGVATGPCQGKACVAVCMKMVAEHRSIPLADVDVMTFRPPVRPVPLAALAADDAHDLVDAAQAVVHHDEILPAEPLDIEPAPALPKDARAQPPAPSVKPGGHARGHIEEV